MLAVDRSFLTIPGVSPAKQPVSVIAIYLSISCILFSLFLTIILIEQSRASGRSSSAEMVSMSYKPPFNDLRRVSFQHD